MRHRAGGAATFDGHATTEYDVRANTADSIVRQRLFIDVDRTSGKETRYGEETTATAASSGLVQTNRNQPPYVFPRLAAGERAAITAAGTITSQAILNGVTGPASTTTFNGTDIVTFVGFETVTVPAGTFLTCRMRTPFRRRDSRARGLDPCRLRRADEDDSRQLSQGRGQILLDGAALP